MIDKIAVVLILLYVITLICLIIHIYCYIHDIPKTIFENIQTPVKQSDFKNNHIKVWTYWEGKPSKIADICSKSISYSCEQANKLLIDKFYEYIHITPDNIDKYLGKDLKQYVCYTVDDIILKSDLIRLSLLQKYGGFWLDMSILVLKPINMIFEEKHKYDHFYAIYNPRNDSSNLPNYPVIEMSMMYSPPNHPLIKDWLNGMNFIEKCDVNDRINYSHSKQFFKSIKFLQPSHHYSYYVFRHVLINSGGLHKYNNVFLISDHKKKYMGFLHYNIKDLLELPQQEFEKKYNLKNTTCIKLCGFYDRKILENIIKNGTYHPESVMRVDA